MTTMSADAGFAPSRRSNIRLVCGYGVILAVLPYLVLKVLWVSGNMVGVPETSPAYRGWEAQNAATLGMDVVAIVVALAFTHRWGLRLPAWLVVVPIWVGTGFLAPAAVEVPVGFAGSLLSTGRLVSMEGGLVEPWTYAVVYTSFALQGVLLSVAFVLYARARWDGLLVPPVTEPSRGSTHGVQTVLGGAGAALAGAVALVRLFEAVAAPAGWTDGKWTFTLRLVQAVEGSLAGLAALGILGLVGFPVVGELLRRVPFRVLLGLAWTGSGTMFAYGLLRTFSTLAGAPLTELIPPVARLLDFAALLAGLVVGLTGAFLLAERRAVLGGAPAVDHRA